MVIDWFDFKGYINGIAIKYDDHKFIVIPLLIWSLINVSVWYLDIKSGIAILIFTTLLIILVSIFHIWRMIQREIRNNQKQTQALIALYDLNNFNAPIPALSGWAATPELMVSVMSSVREINAKHVLELGAGASTSIIPYFFKNEGLLTSLEHEIHYLEKAKLQIAVHRPEMVALHHAPLKEQSVNQEKFLWYDIEGLTLDKPIDLLIVDGPPLKTQKLARYPALPILYRYLSENALILLDDADREEERSILERWKKEFPNIYVEIDHTLKGLAKIYIRK